MSAPLRIEHLSAYRAALLGRRHMNFILVNGRTPRPQSFCARCGEPPSGQATYEKSQLGSSDHECYAGEGKFAVSIVQNHARAS
jgi:hypothetical protein